MLIQKFKAKLQISINIKNKTKQNNKKIMGVAKHDKTFAPRGHCELRVSWFQLPLK